MSRPSQRTLRLQIITRLVVVTLSAILFTICCPVYSHRTNPAQASEALVPVGGGATSLPNLRGQAALDHLKQQGL
jgi:hypothetical protein